MSQPSGFVPIPFHIVGRILLGIAGPGILIVGIGYLSGWYRAPLALAAFFSILILVGLYMIYVVPREPIE